MFYNNDMYEELCMYDALPWQPGMTSQAQQGPMPNLFPPPGNNPPDR